MLDFCCLHDFLPIFLRCCACPAAAAARCGSKAGCAPHPHAVTPLGSGSYTRRRPTPDKPPFERGHRPRPSRSPALPASFARRCRIPSAPDDGPAAALAVDTPASYNSNAPAM
ncbi:hypothetical protein Thpro_022670 [Acidihalobacter prosperus]|uniref:Uncharacterized protein n=1 Tax=Acidihalobacter prosperus TaxID=160660 RepID=A0A1A6C1J8_9GAMM|nr:hypothetical protein Thpro_022670 [Acidihalobacter prosperus]